MVKMKKDQEELEEILLKKQEEFITTQKKLLDTRMITQNDYDRNINRPLKDFMSGIVYAHYIPVYKYIPRHQVK